MVKASMLALMAAMLFCGCALESRSQRTDRRITAELPPGVVQLIRSRTPERILSVTRVSADELIVTTGYTAFDAGGGNEFTLKRAHGRWRIVSEQIWMV